jgi:Putative auto-transporter adhesin, head GIN domain
MKIKQTLLFLSILAFGSGSIAQGVSKREFKTPVIIAESGIKGITASRNIDLVLFNADEEDIKATVAPGGSNKLKISYAKGHLKVATKWDLPADERITVHVYVSNLQTLNLYGNVFARSMDVLNASNLVVNLDEGARIALKTRGKMKVNAPENYRTIEEQRYHLIISAD